MKSPLSSLSGTAVLLTILILPVKLPAGPEPTGRPKSSGKTAPNASTVPYFSFADTLDKQEKQLRNNPLVERFQRSRQAPLGDPHYPRYHFTSPEGQTNDPNGLSYWNGRWHLFYQGYPSEDPRQHWDHAVSDDLVHWRDLPYAIYPGPEEKCYSGSVFIERDRAIAMYHGVGAGTMVAVSSDPLLLNWERVAGDAVIPLPEAGQPQQPMDKHGGGRIEEWKSGDDGRTWYRLRDITPEFAANSNWRFNNIHPVTYPDGSAVPDLYICYGWPSGDSPQGRGFLVKLPNN